MLAPPVESTIGKPLTRIRILAHGDVQGVSYRWFTQHAAVELRITGFAKNLSDGTVEVQAQGTEAALEELRKRLRIGPRRATVARLVEESMEPVAGESSFHVR